jgi:hypothetical protein
MYKNQGLCSRCYVINYYVTNICFSKFYDGKFSGVFYELGNFLTFLTPEFKALTTINGGSSIVLH